jgi:hypothetical protein
MKKMRTIEYMHRDHLQLRMPSSRVNRPPAPTVNPCGVQAVWSVALAAVGGCFELAERALLNLPHPLSAEPDPLTEVTQ